MGSGLVRELLHTGHQAALPKNVTQWKIGANLLACFFGTREDTSHARMTNCGKTCSQTGVYVDFTARLTLCFSSLAPYIKTYYTVLLLSIVNIVFTKYRCGFSNKEPSSTQHTHIASQCAVYFTAKLCSCPAR